MSKGIKTFLLILSALLILGGTGFLILPKFLNEILQRNVQQRSNEASQSTESESLSAFGNLAGSQVSSGLADGSEVDGGSVTTPVIPNSGSFLYRLKNAGGSAVRSYDSVLVGKEILIEAIASGEGKVYRVVASKNQNSVYKTGSDVSFNPIIEPKNLVIKTGESSFSFSHEMEGYKIPDSLKTGDKVVFICEQNDCREGRLSWALVF